MDLIKAIGMVTCVVCVFRWLGPTLVEAFLDINDLVKGDRNEPLS